MSALCRDCFARIESQAARRCFHCGRPRLLRHGELDQLEIAHIDCDAFYAAIEKRDDPRLVDLPLIVGGGRRGVVSTACYVARLYGVKSAMPMFQALKLCPDAVVVRPNMAKYAQASRQLRALFESLTPLVEPLSLDEAFLDLSGTRRLHKASAAETLARLAARVEQEIGITISIGLSYCKFLAKIASDLDKPRGFAVIGRAEALGFLADKPVSLIWGVGRSLAATLEKDGLRTIKDLRNLGLRELTARYGEIGRRLSDLSHGRDGRAVEADQPMKSISAETTFETDLADPSALRAVLWTLCERVAARAKAKGVAGKSLHLKLKTAEFRLRTLSRQLADPTQLAEVMYRHGADLLSRAADGTSYRLIGIGIAALVDGALADPADLIDTQSNLSAAAERTMDSLRQKFGTDAIVKGRGFKPVRDS